MNSAFYRLLKVNRNISIATFNRLLRIKGMDCYFREPYTDTKSIFGREDIIDYGDEWTPKKLLVLNLFQMDLNSGGETDFDTFYGEAPYILTLKDDMFKIQTQIKVDFFGREMVLKVDHHRNLVPHIHEQLFIKNMLVPAT